MGVYKNIGTHLRLLLIASLLRFILSCSIVCRITSSGTMRSTAIVAIVVLCVFSIHFGQCAKEPRLNFDILKHQPCTPKPSPNELIRFSSNAHSRVIDDPKGGPGCKTIVGLVQVFKPIVGNLQVYVKVRTSSKGPIEKCVGADRNNCGGIGSCVYCNVCASVKDAQKKTSSAVRVEASGKPINCSSGISAGKHYDVSVSYCPPRKSELFSATGMDQQIWEGSSGENRRHLISLEITIFREPVNKLSAAELEKAASAGSTRPCACHKVIGVLYE